MHMIGKLGKDGKADWQKHLPELVHAYNFMRSVITGYNPHNLMFEHQLCIPIHLYFVTGRGTQKHQHVNHYIAKVHERLWGAFKEAQTQSTSVAERHKQHYDRKANAISLKLDDLVLAKVNTYGGVERWRIGWRMNHMKWSTKLQKVSLPTLWKTSGPDAHESSTKFNFFSSL